MKLTKEDVVRIDDFIVNNGTRQGQMTNNNLTAIVQAAEQTGEPDFAAKMVQFFFKFVGLGQTIFKYLTVLPVRAFSGLNLGTDTFVVPPTVTIVAPEAFANTNVGAIQYNPAQRSVPKNCFANSTVKKIVIGESVEVIEENAFSECGDLELVVLPKNLKRIKRNAFDRCNKDVTIEIWGELLDNADQHKFKIEDYNMDLEPDEETGLTGDAATDFYNNAFNLY